MSTEPTSNLDPEKVSPPVEEMIPLVSPSGGTNMAADGENVAGESEEEKPLTPAEMDRYECRSCGNTYEPTKGDSRGDVSPGVEFKNLPVDWRCTVCGASRSQFSNIGPAGQASGF